MLPLLSFFADVPSWCSSQFLGLLPWYQYLPFYQTQDPNNPQYCNVNLDLTQSSNWNELWLIAIALIDDMLRVAGFLAVIMIIYGAIRFMTSQGEPENIKAAQGTIFNAIIGLVIAIISISTVNFIGNQLGGSAGPSGLPEITANSDFISNIFNIVFGIIGAISVLMVMIGGFKYVTSTGDSGKVNSAKNTILYALIGLVISVLSFAIVNFLLVKL